MTTRDLTNTDHIIHAPKPDIVHSLDISQTSKLIREDLKKNYPGVTFSVRLDRHLWAPSIHVEWTGGPEAPSVRRHLDHYIREVWDSNTDGYVDRGPDLLPLPSGHTLHVTSYGVKHLHVKRHD